MTDLEIFESLRPDVEPLSLRDRTSMRLDLFGSEASAGSTNGTSASADVYYDLDRGLVTTGPRAARGHRRLLSIAAACLIAVGFAAVWATIGSRQAADPAPAQQPPSPAADSTPPAQQLEAPVWYDTIRPLLPDGFDQIVLTEARPEVVAFKAFRTATRQLLDITITLQAGYDVKDTGEALTFSDEHGGYVESAGSVTLTTPDERRVTIRCGLRPIGGGSAGAGGLLDADQDSCDAAGIENLDIDPLSRRVLAATLADEFPTDAATPAFGQPDTRPETNEITQVVNDFVGGDRPFDTMQADGVLRLANLSPTLGEPSTTELTVINGIWPPNGDGSTFDSIYTNSPQGRFYVYGDIAAALVVVNRTAYHIATTDIDEARLTALGELLQHLIAASRDTTLPIATRGPTNTAPVARMLRLPP
jgi:hypothetical protein